MSQFDTVWGVSDLKPNEQKALNALLTSTSVEEAAKKCGLSVATLKRYKSSEPFATVYRQQRRLVFEGVLAGVQQLGTEAISALKDALQDGDVNTRLRAASRTLEYLLKFTEEERKLLEQEEILRRIEALENGGA